MRSTSFLLLGLGAVPLCAQAGVAGRTAASPAPAGTVETDFSRMRVVLQPAPPPYPPLAKIAKIQGTVVVELVVGTDGIPLSARAIEGPVQLRATAETYAMAWKFAPFMKDGAPQTSRFKLTMPFRLREAPSREGVLQLRLEAPEPALDRQRVTGYARAALASAGVAAVTAATADPAKADSVALDLRVTRLGDTDAYRCEARLRVSRLRDMMVETNTPGQPQQVWHRRAALIQRGEAGLEESLGSLMREVCLVHFANTRPGSGDLTMRYAGVPAPAPAHTIVQPRVLTLPPPPPGKAEGPVTVLLNLDAQGRPRLVRMITGAPEVEEAALAYALAVTCEPMREDGVARPGVLVLTVPFQGK